VVTLRPSSDSMAGPVRHPTPVGVKEAPEKVCRMPLHDGALPRVERQPSLVLSTRPVLREHARPVAPTVLHDNHTRPLDVADAATNVDSLEEPRDVGDDAGEVGVARDAQHEARSRPRDAAIAEVVTEEPRVCLWIRRASPLTDEARRGPPWLDTVLAPLSEGRTADP